jgi:hypothetical protein
MERIMKVRYTYMILVEILIILALALMLTTCGGSSNGGSHGDGSEKPPDTVSPVIILLGETIITVTINDTYIDPGAVAIDDVDGIITDQIEIVNPCDVSVPGIYVVTYNVADSAGNKATEVTRKIIVHDPTAPFISLNGEDRIVIAVGDPYSDPGATAVDDVDGDITQMIVIENPVNPWVPGTYVIRYNVTDSSGNSAIEVIREVVVDGSPPVITLIGSPSIVSPAGEGYRDPGATAMDDVDGDISGRISVDNPLRSQMATKIPGTYVITYSVSDTVGNEADEVTREVIILDMTPPVITLQGSSRIILTVGDSYSDPGATAEDNVEGDVSYKIVTDNQVDATKTGLYTVTYNVTDAAGNSAVEVIRHVNVVVFQSTFGRVENRSDTGSEIIEVEGGNFLVIGTSASAGVGRPDIWVIKIDGSGNEVWNRVFSSNLNDYGYSLCQTSDGNYVIAGTSMSTPTSTWVIKIDQNGNEIWWKKLTGSSHIVGRSIIENSEGELLLAGDSGVVKLDADGDELWSINYSGPQNNHGTDIIESSDGTYVVAGTTSLFVGGSTDAWVLKIDDFGNEIWAKSFGGEKEDSASSIVETSDGNYTVAGSTNSFGGIGYDVFVFSLDQFGNEIWNNTVGTAKDEYGSDIAAVSTGGYIITGNRIEPLGIAQDELLVVKLDGGGNVEWDGIFGGWRDDYGTSIIETSDGHFAILGTTHSFGDSYGDIWVIKF